MMHISNIKNETILKLLESGCWQMDLNNPDFYYSSPSNVKLLGVFDALTSVRPYKKSWTFEDAVTLIKEERGEHFDPELVDLFLNAIDEIHEVYLAYKDV